MYKIWLFLIANIGLYIYTLVDLGKILLAPQNVINEGLSGFFGSLDSWFSGELAQAGSLVLSWNTIIFVIAMIALVILIIKFWGITWIVLCVVTSFTVFWLVVQQVQGSIAMTNYYLLAVLVIGLANIYLAAKTLSL